jgi:hypothetical protein
MDNTPVVYYGIFKTLCALRAFACPVKFRRTAQRIYPGRFKIKLTCPQDNKNSYWE